MIAIMQQTLSRLAHFLFVECRVINAILLALLAAQIVFTYAAHRSFWGVEIEIIIPVVGIVTAFLMKILDFWITRNHSAQTLDS